MSNYDQCARCRKNYHECGCYDHADNSFCRYYEKPIDNSRMFARWYKFSGRIGRLEYILTLLISIVAYFFVLFGVGVIIGGLGITVEDDKGAYVFSLACLIPTAYLMLAAGIKRTHDTGVNPWYSIIPVVVSLCVFIGIIPGVFPIVIGITGCIYLFKDAGMDGVNEHGSNPTQPYHEQISLEDIA